MKKTLPYKTNDILEKLADLTRKLGRVPTYADTETRNSKSIRLSRTEKLVEKRLATKKRDGTQPY